MKKLLIILVTALMCTTAAMADNDTQAKPDRKEWMKEMRAYKNDFICRALNITDQQREQFLNAYNSMDEELQRVQSDASRMEREVRKKGDKATDLEYEKAAEAMFELKGKENAIEMKYLPQFKAILSPAQLFKLKEAERDFMKSVMKQHQQRKRK